MKHFDLVAHINRQREFSGSAFGPGARTAAIIDHIKKELKEVAAAPRDLTEWVDLILLALDGAWRSGHSAEDIAEGLDSKLTINETRIWPDWRTADPDKAIEHVRGEVPAESANCKTCSSRLTCIVACKEMNGRFCAVDDELKRRGF